MWRRNRNTITHETRHVEQRRARENIFRPGMNAETRDFISRCEICRSLDDKQCKETLVSHEVPIKPWGIVAYDILQLISKTFW